VQVGPLLQRIHGFEELLDPDPAVDARHAAAFAELRRAEATNSPLGVTGRATRAAQPVTGPAR
jgi:hypothetical protein